MPIIKPRKSMKKSDDASEDEVKKSLALELNMQRRGAKRKMADGGLVDPDAGKKTLGQIIGYPGSGPVKKAHGGMIDKEDAFDEQHRRMSEEYERKQEHNDEVDAEAHDSQEAAEEHRYADGGMVDDDRAMSIAQAIRSRKMDAIHPEDPLDQLEPEYDDLNEAAASNPEEINPSEGDEDFDLQNRIAAIRSKRKYR